jgi:hypothetical protein
MDLRSSPAPSVPIDDTEADERAGGRERLSLARGPMKTTDRLVSVAPMMDWFEEENACDRSSAYEHQKSASP